MSEGKSNKKNPSSPPVDSGRPFVFSTHSKESTETPKDSEKSSPDADPGESSAEAASKSDDVNTDAQGGGRPKKDGANSSSLSSSKLGEQRPQIPMELLHLQRSPSRSKEGSSQNSGGGDQGKRRSSRAIKRKRFDDEIVTTASCIAPPGQQGLAPILGSSSTLQSQQQQTPDFAADKDSSPTSQASSFAPTQPPASLHFTAPPPPTPHRQNSLTMPPASAGGSNHPHSAPPVLTPANAAAAAAAAAAHSKGKGVGKIAKSRGASSLGDWDPSLANSRAALKKKTGKKNKRAKREGAWKDLSRWKPTDDLALVTAVQQTHDLVSVFRGVKFTCHFTLNEVQERWYALMYEPVISKMAIQAIKNLHPEVVLSIQRKTLFSKQEQDLLGTIKSTTQPQPTLKDFEELLRKNPHVFHSARTPRILSHYWQSLKQYTLLPDQSVQPMPRDNHILNFLDAEAAINDGELFEERDDIMEHELAASDRKVKKEIRHLEAEVSKWQVLVDKVRGDNPPDFDSQTLAVLRGRLVRYLMRSKEITIGRSTKDSQVDVDLKLEGPAWKISRKQGVIKLRNSGEFFIANEGKRPMFIDGRPILAGKKSRLSNSSVLEIAGLKFVFLINQDLIEAIRQEAIKMYQNS